MFMSRSYLQTVDHLSYAGLGYQAPTHPTHLDSLRQNLKEQSILIMHCCQQSCRLMGEPSAQDQ
jgi:hypothetical protein